MEVGRCWLLLLLRAGGGRYGVRWPASGGTMIGSDEIGAMDDWILRCPHGAIALRVAAVAMEQDDRRLSSQVLGTKRSSLSVSLACR